MAILHFLFAALTVCGIFVESVTAKYVFAHIVMGNTYSHTQATWTNDITLAKNAGIDAFVLNCGHGDPTVTNQIPIAFAAAEAAGSQFKLFFAFDYLGGGSVWPASEVITLLNQYKGSSAYFNYNNAPFVSTFEGTGNTNDWAQGGTIRSAVGSVYFVPDWTSFSPSGISSYVNDFEGFFSWDMWPNGAVSKTDEVDFDWKMATPGKTYMMGVSPWFFHSGSGGKDWVWRGDNLWADRWAQTLDVQPDFVQYVFPCLSSFSLLTYLKDRDME
jgi:glucan endo-1,3-alpha-glucosidase